MKSSSPIEPSPRTIVSVNGVELCVQSFGDDADPTILLIHGAATSMGGWDDRFCARLAAGGRFVIRYDQRDTGESTSYPTGAPGYGMRDLIDDVFGLLDAFDVERAHVVGMSMGGGIAMGAALARPDRVASLTLIATTPGGEGLPAMSAEFLAHIRTPLPDASDRDAMLEHLIALLRIFSGGSGLFDEAYLRAGVKAEFDRTRNLASSQVNHFVMDVGDPMRHRLGEITAPTLVIHGDADPVFPLGHAHALERAIPGARLLVLKKAGHELPPAVWDIVVPAMVEHTSSRSGPRTI